MDTLTNLALLTGGAAAAGFNLYLTIFSLGIAHLLGLYILPDRIQFIANPFVLIVLFVMVVVEFFIDKIPWLDSAWDILHTFLRPLGAAAMGYLIAPESNTNEIIMATTAGGLALTTHAGKASTRALANTSPEPFSNSFLSLLEDGLVLFLVYMITSHPYLTIGITGVLIVGSAIMIYYAYKIAGGVIKWIFGNPKDENKQR